jgi:hypothetical protein
MIGKAELWCFHLFSSLDESFELRLDDGKQERTGLLLVCRFAGYKLADAFSTFSTEVSVLGISGE